MCVCVCVCVCVRVGGSYCFSQHPCESSANLCWAPLAKVKSKGKRFQREVLSKTQRGRKDYPSDRDGCQTVRVALPRISHPKVWF